MPHRCDDGATSVEYALIAALIAAVIATAVFTLGQANLDSWRDSCTKISTPMDGTSC